MNTKDRKRGKLQAPADSANTAISSSDEVKQLKDQLYEMQMEIDLLKATIDVLKKDPGVNLERLKNSEKTVVIDAVRAKYALSDLLQQMSLPRSSYYLCRAIQRKRDKYQGTKEQIRDIFTENRVDPENAGRRAQTFHVKERMFSGQLCLRGIFQACKAPPYDSNGALACIFSIILHKNSCL